MLVAIVGGLSAITYAVRRMAIPAHRRPWRLLLWSAWFFFAGIVLRAVVPGAGAWPPTSMALIPDAFALVGYVLMGYAFAGMLRRRRAAEDDPARVDALLVGLAAAFMCWTYLIVPSMTQTGLTP